MAKKRIIIVGAGLAGLSAAWYLQKKGIDYLLLEKDDAVGGLCRSRSVNGFTFDCDGHLLHFRNKYVLELVKGLLKGNISRHKRNAWINYRGRFIPYPFQANLHALPRGVASECLVEFLKAKKPQEFPGEQNFLKWVHSSFGRGIAKHFMLPYNEKFWTVPLRRLTCGWLNGFITVPTISEMIKSYCTGSSRQIGYNASFYYPKTGGIGALAVAFERRLKNLRKNQSVTSIDLRKKELTINGTDKEKFDILVMTFPLPEAAKLINPIPKDVLKLFGKLRWNSIYNINLGIDHAPKDGRHWVYFPQKEVSFFRVGMYHNFSQELVPRGKAGFYLEVAYSNDRPISKKDILRNALNDLRVSGLEGSGRVEAVDTNDIKYAYPIFDKNYDSARGGIIKFLRSRSVIPCGRYGSWRYMSMEQAMLDGISAAVKTQPQ